MANDENNNWMVKFILAAGSSGSIMKMTKQEAPFAAGLRTCVVIGIFRMDQLRLQDAGLFPMPPHQFYELMKQAHINGQLGHNSPKMRPSKIIKPN
jgi:hypothetical protein